MGKCFVQKLHLKEQNIFQKIYFPVVLVRGTQRLFSVKYLLGGAKIV